MIKWFLNKWLAGGIINCDAEAIRMALSNGADPNAYHKGHTLLMRACFTGNDLVVGMLVDAGADPNKYDKLGRYDTYQFCETNEFEGMAEHVRNCRKIFELRTEMEYPYEAE